MTRTKSTYLALLAVLLSPMAANADFIGDRATFEAELDTIIVDGYENPAYGVCFTCSDAVMSAVLGETQYTTTGFVDWNIVFDYIGNPAYCAGCNGSYLLDFTSTSVGNANGVFGVGFDVLIPTDYFAFITYGNGVTENFLLSSGFFGFTSDTLIASIHFGLINGGTTRGGSIAMDNLTIGNRVPEPGTLALLGLGLAGMSLTRRRKKV